MRSHLALGFIALTACSKNLDELRSIEVGLDLQLVEKMDIAQNLTERRDEFERLQAIVDAALGEAGVTEAELLASSPAVPPSSPLPIVALPPPSFWEGSEGERLRRRITEAQDRIAALDKEIGPVKDLNRRKAHTERILRALERLRQQRAQSPIRP